MATISDDEFKAALEEFSVKSKRKHAAIIIGSNAKARYFDFRFAHEPGVEIWGFNAIRKEWVPYWHRMFNIHLYDLLVKYDWPVFEDANWCSRHPRTRFITADKWPDGRMASAEIFPREEIEAKFPRGGYHCNSCDWLIAYALLEGFEEIHLHGWTLTRDGAQEQMSARACAEYWCGLAEGLGTKIVLAEDSDLFTAYHLVRSNRVYGYEDCPAFEDRVTGRDPPYKYSDGW